MNGINKYVTETSEEIPVESIELVPTEKPEAKAKPRPKLAVTLSPISTGCCSELDIFRYLTEVFLDSCDNFA